MGAVAVDYVNQPSNNVKYVGNGAVKVPAPTVATPPISTNVSTVVNKSVESVFGSNGKAGGKTIGRSNLLGLAVSLAAPLIYDYFTDDEKASLTDSELQAVERYESLQKSYETQLAALKDLEEMNHKVLEKAPEVVATPFTAYSQGEALPTVLSNNSKALVKSVDSLASVNAKGVGAIVEAVGVLSNSLSKELVNLNTTLKSSLLIQQQLLDISSATLQIEAQKFANPSVQVVATSLDKLSENVKPFNASIVGVNNALDELVKLKAVDNEQEKEHYALRSEEIELSKEAFEYNKTAQTVKDLDGNTIAKLEPREAELVKNAVVAVEKTDINNFELDEEDIDIVTPFDISSIYGYEHNSVIYENIIKGLGGSV
ncbi:hypothetical protein [Sulfurospirillum barnesii]|uniref:Uncharacterized protein n=1 Tax=Sulfurospirillum barnesii (strain ATCC 700032 / DSM 10660 / SES-3) TaxID=760154 RepID=I3Y0N8_SULBS|nr:hypothetical protein [Sulfurospirillum barnesii]AFL69762.1 hypothetical protein Sulba_2495 [Sulfurospirillum barnesii SES-3]